MDFIEFKKENIEPVVVSGAIVAVGAGVVCVAGGGSVVKVEI